MSETHKVPAPLHNWYVLQGAFKDGKKLSPTWGEIREVLAYVDALREQLAASEPVSTAYTLPDTVQAIVDAAAAYEKKHGHWQDYRMSLRDDAFPVDKTERAIVVAYRKHAASEGASA